MDARTLARRLRDACAALDGEQAPEAADLEALLNQLPAAVDGAAQADILALQQAVDDLLDAVAERRDALATELDSIRRGREGNKGYHSLRAHRTAQRLYRRA